MTTLRIKRSRLSGRLTLPPSKSHTLRAILFAALCRGESRVISPLYSPDSEAMIKACQAMGADIERGEDMLIIRGVAGDLSHLSGTIDAGNSGIVLRFLSALGALAKQPVTLTGDHSIRTQRPIAPLVDALQPLGTQIIYHDKMGRPPLTIDGRVQAGVAHILGPDSQPLSALLIAFSLPHSPVTEIRANELGERPWIELTLDWLRRQGAVWVEDAPGCFTRHSQLTLEPFTYTVPGDLSGAAFPVVAAIVTHSMLEIDRLDLTDIQGDRLLFKTLEEMGARFTPGTPLTVHPTASLMGREIDLDPMIDAINILSVVGCFTEGQTRLYNGAIARKKECDRIAVMAQELRKMGAKIEENPDGLTISKSILHGAKLRSHKDHRVAMALTVAALFAEGETEIEGVECVAKSYPHFFEELRKMGADITILEPNHV